MPSKKPNFSNRWNSKSSSDCVKTSSPGHNVFTVWKKGENCYEFCYEKGQENTVWKFHAFCIFQILREINFEDFWSAKSAILPHLEALNFDIYDFLHFLKAEIDQMEKIHRL